jgi:CRISPR/Cas system-associated protein endoribonuclease Cas2
MVEKQTYCVLYDVYLMMGFCIYKRILVNGVSIESMNSIARVVRALLITLFLSQCDGHHVMII